MLFAHLQRHLNLTRLRLRGLRGAFEEFLLAVFHGFAAMAEFERELTPERTHAGLQQAKALGRRGGRKPSIGPAEVRASRRRRRR